MSKINPGTGLYTGPYLESHEVTNVTTQIGTHAYLPCKVSSWMYSKQIKFKSTFCLKLFPNILTRYLFCTG